VAWHRKGFRLFWTWKVRHGQPGRPVISREVRDLIRKMCRENASWGTPRIHGNPFITGMVQSKMTISGRSSITLWFGARAKHETSLPHKELHHGLVKATVPNLTGGTVTRPHNRFDSGRITVYSDSIVEEWATSREFDPVRLLSVAQEVAGSSHVATAISSDCLSRMGHQHVLRMCWQTWD
jgi:hypothetical protein